MGKRAKAHGGWQLRQPGGVDTTIYVRFSHAGRQREFSTGTSDPAEAKKAAPNKYAEVVSGRRSPRPIAAAFDETIAKWLVEYRKDHKPGTADTVEMYAHAHWLPYFGDLEHITKESAEDYARERLTQVRRSTVRKELSALRRFADWAGLRITIAGLKKHGNAGRRHKQARKAKATILSPRQMERMLAKLPEYSAKAQRDGWKHPVRDFFRVLWETGLREGSLFALEAPKHYRKGSRVLFIDRDIDKTADAGEREIDITPAAAAALTRCTPDVGRIFRPFSLREPLARACVAAKVPIVSPYDLRHSRISYWANQPGVPLPGVSYLVGHQSLSTTAKYVQAQRRAATAVIRGTSRGSRGP